MPMMITTRDGDGNPFGNRTDNTQDRGWLAAMKAAKTKVRIQSPNFNDDAARQGVLETVRRGVTVELVLSKGFNDGAENLPGQGGTNEENVRDLYKELRKGGMADPCATLQVRWYSVDGTQPLVGSGPGASHAKYMSIDSALVIVGSGNMDTQSWNHSHETNVIVDDAATTRAWDAAVFEPSFERGTFPDACPR
jgi:phosphatidylserine/phosphatidylglycerophosphate/cardiolipin synthase-like enzyme